MDKINEYIPSTSTWSDLLTIQKLLDVIAQIIANEYVLTVKENPQLFTSGG